MWYKVGDEMAEHVEEKQRMSAIEHKEEPKFKS